MTVAGALSRLLAVQAAQVLLDHTVVRGGSAEVHAMLIQAMLGIPSYRNQGYGANARKAAREEFRDCACHRAWHPETMRFAGRCSAPWPDERAIPVGIPSYSLRGMEQVGLSFHRDPPSTYPVDLEKERKL